MNTGYRIGPHDMLVPMDVLEVPDIDDYNTFFCKDGSSTEIGGCDWPFPTKEQYLAKYAVMNQADGKYYWKR